MNDIIMVILAGLLGTAFMTFFMWMITDLGIAKADMVKAVGSLYTKKYENSLNPGLVIQFSFGVIFAFIYAFFLGFFPLSSLLGYMVFSTMFSLLHGVTVGFSLVVLVAQYHPLERFQEAGSDVVVGHVLGHIVYGLVVGLILGSARVRLFEF